MKILCIHSFTVNEGKPEFNAISYHRMIMPHRVLRRHTDWEVHHSPTSKLSDEFLSNFQLVIFLRFIDDMAIVEQLRKLGIKFGIDEDDYWILPEKHVAYQSYLANDLPNKIINSIKACDFVITTTPILASKIKPLNPNVYIIENGIDTLDSSWQPNKELNERIRFGFLGGSTHFYDIYKIAHDVSNSMYDNHFRAKCQVALAHSYKQGEPSVFVGYEKVLTDHFKSLPFQYRKDLLNGIKPDGTNQYYRRLDFKSVEDFATLYNQIDVSVCPLESNEFNSCKSELKMLEAGFMDSAIMLSDVNPYSLIATKDNSFMFERGDFRYWYKYILKNPNALNDKKAALKETVKKYDLAVLSENRKQLYETII